MSALLLLVSLFYVAPSQGLPSPVKIGRPANDLTCRDFSTIQDSKLIICDIITADRQKTDLYSYIITLQKEIDQKMADKNIEPIHKERYKIIKDNLSSIERYAINSIVDICNLKGMVIKQGSNLVAGCIYNQITKIKKQLIQISTNPQFSPTDTQWPNKIAEAKFDNFIDDALLDLAEKNKKKSPDNVYQKTLMKSTLQIYGDNNGAQLYAGFWAVCSIEEISKTAANAPVDGIKAHACEENMLDDLQQILFLAIN